MKYVKFCSSFAITYFGLKEILGSFDSFLVHVNLIHLLINFIQTTILQFSSSSFTEYEQKLKHEISMLNNTGNSSVNTFKVKENQSITLLYEVLMSTLNIKTVTIIIITTTIIVIFIIITLSELKPIFLLALVLMPLRYQFISK